MPHLPKKEIEQHTNPMKQLTITLIFAGSLAAVALAQSPSVNTDGAKAEKARIQQLTTHVDYTFGSILPDLEIPPEKVQRIKDLLLERYLGEQDAMKIMRKRLADDKKFETNGELHLAVRNSHQVIDSEIDTAAGPEAVDVRELIASKLELMQVNVLASALASQGHALDGRQKLALASAMSREFDPARNPAAMENRRAAVEDGLSRADRAVLSRLAGSLDSVQSNYIEAQMRRQTAVLVNNQD